MHWLVCCHLCPMKLSLLLPALKVSQPAVSQRHLVPGSSSPVLQTTLPQSLLSCWVLAVCVCSPSLPRELFCFPNASSKSLIHLASPGSRNRCAWKSSLADDCTVVGMHAVGRTLPRGCFLLNCPILTWGWGCMWKTCSTQAAAAHPLCSAASRG